MNKEIKHWQEHWPNFTFKKLVCMYINDCMQYLDRKLKGFDQKSDLTKTRFKPTEEEDLIYYGLRDLKDMCMRICGEDPQNWKDEPH